jgi:hypothetical protein
MKLYGNLEGGGLKQPDLQDYGEIVNARGDSSGATTIDLDLGNIVTAKATDAITWTFSNPITSGKCCSFTLILQNGGVGAQTWPGSVCWPSGTVPTLTASGFDVLSFFTLDGGTTWRGVLAQTDSKVPV